MTIKKRDKTTSVTCKDCGLVFKKVNYSLKHWKGRCHPCSRIRCWRLRYGKTADEPILRRIKVPVTCTDCGKKWTKREDSLPYWKGRRCIPCARVEVGARPELQEVRRQNGIAVMRRVGRLPLPKLENRRRGPSHHNWRGGITSEHMVIRHSMETKEWRLTVFARDGFQCVACGVGREGKITADHIQPFSLFPELRFTVSNGRTLCRSCHEKYGAMVRKGVITRSASFDYEKVAA